MLLAHNMIPELMDPFAQRKELEIQKICPIFPTGKSIDCQNTNESVVYFPSVISIDNFAVILHIVECYGKRKLGD